MRVRPFAEKRFAPFDGNLTKENMVSIGDWMLHSSEFYRISFLTRDKQ